VKANRGAKRGELKEWAMINNLSIQRLEDVCILSLNLRTLIKYIFFFQQGL
jgi:hypothetical protein